MGPGGLRGTRPDPVQPEIATDIQYDQIRHLLEASVLSPTPSEAQGILCGLICGGAPDPEAAWLSQLFPEPACDHGQDHEPTPPDPRQPEARAGLKALARQTLDEIQGAGLGFRVLLPDESRPLAERATALYDWARGFLFALGVLGVSERDLSEQGREVLKDFTDLTRMDLDELGDGEENEQALTELTEFVWVAALLLYEERVTASRGPQ